MKLKLQFICFLIALCAINVFNAFGQTNDRVFYTLDFTKKIPQLIVILLLGIILQMVLIGLFMRLQIIWVNGIMFEQVEKVQQRLKI